MQTVCAFLSRFALHTYVSHYDPHTSETCRLFHSLKTFKAEVTSSIRSWAATGTHRDSITDIPALPCKENCRLLKNWDHFALNGECSKFYGGSPSNCLFSYIFCAFLSCHNMEEFCPRQQSWQKNNVCLSKNYFHRPWLRNHLFVKHTEIYFCIVPISSSFYDGWFCCWSQTRQQNY